MTPRMRVISDNDYSGDPDGLFQLAHLLLSPSVDVRTVIGSHLRPDDPFDPSDQTAANARVRAAEVVELLGLTSEVSLCQGSDTGLADRASPIASAGAQAIVAEAMRDSDLPLYVTLGGGLTELASAYLIEPRIAERMIAVWIGGPEHPGHAEAPPRLDGSDRSEYNARIDAIAARVVFESTIPIWQIPRDAYRQAIISFAELDSRVRPHSAIGAFLADTLEHVASTPAAGGRNLGETYVLGDNPLVLLTALQSPFEPDPSSSQYVSRPAPSFDDQGRYAPGPAGRAIRVFTRLDTRLMFEDMIAKLGARP